MINGLRRSPQWILSVAGICACCWVARIEASSDEKTTTERVVRSNWASFRGPNGDGHSPEIDLPLRWGPSENLTWKLDLPGVGASSPVLWNDRIFLTATTDKGWKRLLLCINRTDGSIRWQQVVSTGDPGPTHAMNQHASSTCVTDGDRVWSFFGKGGLFCHDFDGRLIWERRIGDFLSVWGTAASPILHRDKLIVNCDQDTMLQKEPDPDTPSKAFLAAVDKNTGKTIWQTPRAASRGWSTPVALRQPDGRDELVLNGPDGVHGYDPESGRDLWVYRREVKFGEPCIVAGHGLMFAISGRPGPMFAIRQGSGEGDRTDKAKAWGDNRNARDITSPILVGDELYTATMTGIGTCYDARTGEIRWRERMGKGYTASPVLADGKIYFVSRDGQATVLEPGAKYSVLAVNQLDPQQNEDFLASPAVSNGQIFLRSDRVLYCVGIQR